MRAVGFLLLMALTCVGCPDAGGLEIMPLEDRRVRVNDTMIIDLRVRTATGGEQWSFSAPSIPDIQRYAAMYQSGGTATFRWSPLASQTGMHQFTFTVTSGSATDSETITVEVIQAGGAPKFTQPGTGGTYDLSRSSCVDVDIVVIDEDSTRVDIYERDPRIEGAQLTQPDNFRAQWHWCPTAQQVDATLRYTLHLEANDGQSPPVFADYEIVLLTETKPDCPGESPQISVTAEPRYETVRDYAVRATVTDDQGLKETPLLYYSTTQPAAPPDPTRMSTVTFARESGDTYVAYVPNLNLTVGQEQIVYYMVSATDNDDADGPSCDHTTMSTVGQFVAVEPMNPDLAGYCEPCTSDRQCDGGLCVAASPSFCGVDCGSGCTEGTCQTVSSVGGSSDRQCVPESMSCGGGGPCTADAFEPASNSMAAAPPYTIGDMLEGSICSGDEDFYSLSLTAETNYAFTATGWDSSAADIDIALVGSDGDLIAWSAGTTDVESFEYCPTEGGTYYLWIMAATPAAGSYLVLVSTSGSCGSTTCTDSYENNDSSTYATDIDCAGEETAARICEGDEDWFHVFVSASADIEVVLGCEPGGGDIDLFVKNDAGTTIASSLDYGCDEYVSATLPRGGSYFIRIDGIGADTADYSFLCETTAGSGCTDTRTCPSGTVCGGAAGCVDDACFTPGGTECPADHFCPEPGGIAAASVCVDPCWSSADCRTGYECKTFEGGDRGCAREGFGTTGDICDSFLDCADERTCVTASGYCAEIGCYANMDCPSGDRCVSIGGGTSACLKDCLMGDWICDDTMGTCTQSVDVEGTFRYACVATGMTVPTW